MNALRAAAFAYDNACDCCDGEHVCRANPDQEEAAELTYSAGFAPAMDLESVTASAALAGHYARMGFMGQDGI